MRTVKAWVAFGGTILTALAAAFADDVFGTDDWINVTTASVLSVTTLVAVYRSGGKKGSVDKRVQHLS